jgi:hypothetical protein
MLIWNRRGPTIHPVSDRRELGLACDTGKSDCSTWAVLRAVDRGSCGSRMFRNPRTRSRKTRSRSTSRTSTPSLANVIAIEEPASPPPTTSTSKLGPWPTTTSLGPRIACSGSSCVRHAHLSTRLRASERNPQDLSHADQVGVADYVSVGGEQPRPQVAVAVYVLRDPEQRVARDDRVRLKTGVRRAE